MVGLLDEKAYVLISSSQACVLEKELVCARVGLAPGLHRGSEVCLRDVGLAVDPRVVGLVVAVVVGVV